MISRLLTSKVDVEQLNSKYGKWCGFEDQWCEITMGHKPFIVRTCRACLELPGVKSDLGIGMIRKKQKIEEIMCSLLKHEAVLKGAVDKTERTAANFFFFFFFLQSE